MDLHRRNSRNKLNNHKIRKTKKGFNTPPLPPETGRRKMKRKTPVILQGCTNQRMENQNNTILRNREAKTHQPEP